LGFKELGLGLPKSFQEADFVSDLGFAMASSSQVISETMIENNTAVKKLSTVKPSRA
jgi:hypothetical protein